MNSIILWNSPHPSWIIENMQITMKYLTTLIYDVIYFTIGTHTDFYLLLIITIAYDCNVFWYVLSYWNVGFIYYRQEWDFILFVLVTYFIWQPFCFFNVWKCNHTNSLMLFRSYSKHDSVHCTNIRVKVFVKSFYFSFWFIQYLFRYYKTILEYLFWRYRITCGIVAPTPKYI